MKKLFCFLVLALMQTSLASPGLVVDGTQFKYKGQKIFFSGMNLAWIDYNSDVGAAALDETKWRKAVQDIKSAGGNSIRWWLFNNMSTSPTVNTSTNLVSGLPTNTINNIRKALDIAEANGVMVSLCLFSHNLMQDDQWGNYNGKIPIEANKKLFTDDGIQAFINNALKPVLTAIGNHNAIWTWELFNEPEGMGANIPNASWTRQKMPMADMQKFANRVAAAIHDHDNTLLVSNGIHNTDAFQYWKDAPLRSAGGKNNGILDFYQVHFYPEHQTTAQNPFDWPFSHWNLDKPLVIGEFSAAGWNKETYPAYKVATKTPAQLYLYAYNQGYAGALSWDYGGFNDDVAGKAVTHNYAAAKPGMQALSTQFSQYIDIDFNAATPSSSSKPSSSSVASSSSRASSSSVASSSSRASSSSSTVVTSSSSGASSSGTASSSSSSATATSSSSITSSSSSSGAAPSSSSAPPSAPSSSSSSNFNVSPIRMLSSIPSAAFNVKAMSNGSLLVESNAKALIYLYDSKGNMAQSIQVHAGSSIVRTQVPVGVYVVKNAVNRQTQVVVVK